MPPEPPRPPEPLELGGVNISSERIVGVLEGYIDHVKGLPADMSKYLAVGYECLPRFKEGSRERESFINVGEEFEIKINVKYVGPNIDYKTNFPQLIFKNIGIFVDPTEYTDRIDENGNVIPRNELNWIPVNPREISYDTPNSEDIYVKMIANRCLENVDITRENEKENIAIVSLKANIDYAAYFMLRKVLKLYHDIEKEVQT